MSKLEECVNRVLAAGFSTGHADTLEDLLIEVLDQAIDIRGRLVKWFKLEDDECAESLPPAWRPIETAPTDGTEILAWRKDAGALLVRWACMEDFMTDSEIEQSGLDEAATTADDWFCADFIEGARLEGSEAPTHWMPIPDGPE